MRQARKDVVGKHCHALLLPSQLERAIVTRHPPAVALAALDRACFALNELERLVLRGSQLTKG